MCQSKAFKPKNTVSSVKHGGGGIMLRVWFITRDAGESHHQIHQLYIKPTCGWLNKVFQVDNNPKDILKLALDRIKQASIKLLEWSQL